MLRIARIKHDCWLLQESCGALYKPEFSLTHSQCLIHTSNSSLPKWFWGALEQNFYSRGCSNLILETRVFQTFLLIFSHALDQTNLTRVQRCVRIETWARFKGLLLGIFATALVANEIRIYISTAVSCFSCLPHEDVPEAQETRKDGLSLSSPTQKMRLLPILGPFLLLQ